LQPSRLVSIVIVAHNNWPDLELAVQSALNQSYRAIEVIVVDNGSTDDTAGHLANVFGDRIRYVGQANTGEGGGRNAGFRLARGEFVQFLDGDDLLAPDKIEKQVAMFETIPEIDIVYGDVRQFQTAAGPASFVDWDTKDHEDMLATLLSPSGNGGGLLPDSMLFRREALDRVGQWTEDPPLAKGGHVNSGVDQDYWLRAAWAGCRFKYCPGSLCFYRRRSGQLTADPLAAVRGMEPPLTKAQSYITREPYRSALARRLAHLLMFLAISDPTQSVRDALGRLRKAHALDPKFVTAPAYGIAATVIALRIGPLFFAGGLGPLRRLATKLMGMNSNH
jgi:glycosyltransferase involved in cell wall biosynthesis